MAAKRFRIGGHRLPRRPKGAERLRAGVARFYSAMYNASTRNAKAAGAGIGLLAHMQKKGDVTRHQILRVLNAPVKNTTLVALLRNLGAGKVTLAGLLEVIENAYASQVPDKIVRGLVNCPKGEFAKRAFAVARAYGAPKSFITSRTGERMRRLKWPATAVKEFDALAKEIHEVHHKRMTAKMRGEVDREKAYRRTERLLERDLLERFIKKL